MLKPWKTVKELQERAVNAVGALIEDVPSVKMDAVEHDRITAHGSEIDELIGLRHAGKSYALVVEVKTNGAPRHVRSGVYRLESCVARMRASAESSGGRRLIPMLISPYLSPESRAICIAHDVAYLDLVGNVRIVFDAVYVERAVGEKPKSEARALRSIFTPKAAAILRVLLRDPERAWRVTGLAEWAHASVGHVSNVRKALLDREWMEDRDDGAVLVQPDALLRSWRDRYLRPPGRSIAAYTHLHGKQFDERVRVALNPDREGPRAIYSLSSAAQWFAPYSRTGTQTFYSDDAGAEVLKERLGLKHTGSGANVVVHVPSDESLFDDVSEPAPGVFCTSAIVTYLDLWAGNEREREAAQHLAGELFPWLK